MTEAKIDDRRDEPVRPAFWPSIAGLLLATIFCLGNLPHLIVPGEAPGAYVARELFYWVYAVILLVWLTRVEGLPLSTIGLRWAGWRTLPLGLAIGVAVLALLVLNAAVIIPALGLDASKIAATHAKLVAQPYWFRIELVVRAAVGEEILFRGFLIEHVRRLTGSTACAVIVSVAFFTYSHLSGWGPVQLIPVCAAGIVFALLYVWKRNLPANMIGHFIADAVGFLL
jgi:membrane protease YdiL (CAAX protease family)